MTRPIIHNKTTPAVEKYGSRTDKHALYTAFKMVRRGNIAAVQDMVNDDYDLINQQDEFGQTIIMRAAMHNQEDIAKFLLKPNRNYKCDVDIVDGNGNTALMYACMYDALAVFKLLLMRSKVNFNQKNKNGKTAFMFACSYGRHMMAKMLLGKGVNPLQEDSKGYTAWDVTTDKKTKNLIKPAFDKKREEVEREQAQKENQRMSEEQRFAQGLKDIDSHVELGNLLLKQGHVFYAMKHFQMAAYYFPDAMNYVRSYENTLKDSKTVFACELIGAVVGSEKEYIEREPLKCRIRLNPSYMEVWYEENEGFFPETRRLEQRVVHYPYLYTMKPLSLAEQPSKYTIEIKVLGIGVLPQARIISQTLQSYRSASQYPIGVRTLDRSRGDTVLRIKFLDPLLLHNKPRTWHIQNPYLPLWNRQNEKEGRMEVQKLMEYAHNYITQGMFKARLMG